MLSFAYADFSDPSGLNLVGDASVTMSDVLRVTPADMQKTGGAWFADKQFVGGGFETTFDFQMTEASTWYFDHGGGSGFAFVIQSQAVDALGGGGRAMGYGGEGNPSPGIRNSLAVEFDTFKNNFYSDSSSSHVSVHTRGLDPNSGHEDSSLGWFDTSGFRLDDGEVHSAKIRYEPGSLSIFLDDLDNEALTVAVDLGATIDLDSGHAWVGFTAAAWDLVENHDILQWSFQELPTPATTINIDSVSQAEGNNDTTNFVFQVSLNREGTNLPAEQIGVDYVTADHTATTSDGDYTPVSGTLIFNLAAGQTLATSSISVPVHGDSVSEGFETFCLNLSTTADATILDSMAVGTIRNDERVALSIIDATVLEGNAAALWVVLDFPNANTVAVDFETTDRVAVAGSDYQFSSGTLTFSPGNWSEKIVVPTYDESVDEAQESFVIELSNATGDAMIADATGEALILDPLTYENNTIQHLKDPKGVGGKPGVTTSTIEVNGDGKVFDVNVQLDISHTFDYHLRVSLFAPDGTKVQLFSTEGGQYDNFTDTVLDNDARLPIIAGEAPFTGTFRPEGNLTDFNHKDVAGTWTLEIVDNIKGETGTLNSWSIEVATYVPEPDNPPTAVDDSANTDEDTAIVVSVLANDSDPDQGDVIQVASVTQGTNGSVVDNGDGTVTYAPNTNFNGSDSFTYTITDGRGGTDSATVSVSVAPVNDAPVATDDTAATTPDTPVVIDVLANDTDVDLHTLSIHSVGAASNGTVTVGGSTVTYTPNAGFSGTDTINYTVSDSNGGFDTGTVTVSVGNETAIYVYDIRFDNKHDGKFRRAVVEIRSEDGNAPIGGVEVTATFADETYTGYTDGNGVFTTNRIRNLAGGSYYANVIDLVMANYYWDRLMDREDDSDEVIGPDALLSF